MSSAVRHPPHLSCRGLVPSFRSGQASGGLRLRTEFAEIDVIMIKHTILTIIVLLLGIGVTSLSPVAAASIPHSEPEHQLFTPLIQNQHKPQQPLDWDPRLDVRGAALVPAQVTSGQGYWRLTKAVWYDEVESQGKHHILIDVLDASGQRQAGVPVLILNGGSFTITTETKPDEPYAANFPMYVHAPAYSANPNSGAPADQVTGMGLGDLEHPHWKIHTSYGLTWQWTIAP